MKKNLIVLILLVIACNHFCHAMEQNSDQTFGDDTKATHIAAQYDKRVVMPDKETLKALFEKYDLKEFDKKTDASTTLADKKLSLLAIEIFKQKQLLIYLPKFLQERSDDSSLFSIASVISRAHKYSSIPEYSSSTTSSLQNINSTLNNLSENISSELKDFFSNEFGPKMIITQRLHALLEIAFDAVIDELLNPSDREEIKEIREKSYKK